jgi:hypothetical protein
MSIESKIAQILAESRAADSAEELNEDNVVTRHEAAGDQAVIRTAKETIDLSTEIKGGHPNLESEANHLTGGHPAANKDNAENDVEDEEEATKGGPAKTKNPANAKEEKGDQAVIRHGNAVPAHNPGHAVNFKEDLDALTNGEDLSEEFKTKAATIFEAAIITRVKDEVTRLEEEFEARLQEEAAKNQEGLVEKVDGYLNYVVEQWIKQNEIALESGMKSEIFESFVKGMKGLFEEHYIDVPEEKFDVLGALEEEKSELQAKLDEAVAVNVELTKALNESTRNEIVVNTADGLTETDKEKFYDLTEELSFEDAETFEKKVQTIRENYFTNKATSTLVESVVTDSPIENLTEQKFVDPSVKRYMSVLNNIK